MCAGPAQCNVARPLAPDTLIARGADGTDARNNDTEPTGRRNSRPPLGVMPIVTAVTTRPIARNDVVMRRCVVAMRLMSAAFVVEISTGTYEGVRVLEACTRCV